MDTGLVRKINKLKIRRMRHLVIDLCMKLAFCFFSTSRLIITEPHSKKIFVDVHTSHRANIFSAKFLPASNIRKIVSCAGDGNILFTGKFLLFDREYRSRGPRNLVDDEDGREQFVLNSRNAILS